MSLKAGTGPEASDTDVQHGRSKMRLHPLRTGIAFGAFLGLWHALWSGLVATGAAQAVLDFVLRIHFLQLDVRLAPFDAGLAALLVGVTASVGFVFGLVFAALWNWVVAAEDAVDEITVTVG
jgi:hypothetical protein